MRSSPLVITSFARAVALSSEARARKTGIGSTSLSVSSSKNEETPLPLKSYCAAAQGREWHGPYHDTQYGFPIRTNDNALLERLVLEINQAGLNWKTILKKKENFRKAYHGFDVRWVVSFKEDDCERLRQDAGIIRNRLKINAAVYNAQRIVEVQRLAPSPLQTRVNCSKKKPSSLRVARQLPNS